MFNVNAVRTVISFVMLDSDGSPNIHQVTGQYSVLLPDGRIQTVTYSVRPETGFVVSCDHQISII